MFDLSLSIPLFEHSLFYILPNNLLLYGLLSGAQYYYFKHQPYLNVDFLLVNKIKLQLSYLYLVGT